MINSDEFYSQKWVPNPSKSTNMQFEVEIFDKIDLQSLSAQP